MKALRIRRAGTSAAAALLTAVVGVFLQILGGADYPTVPPVLFILLIPAALVAFGPWWWTPVPVFLAGLFLIFGTFASGESRRLVESSVVDAVGLWLQLLAVSVATVAAVRMTIRSFQPGKAGGFVRRNWKVPARRAAQVMGGFFLVIGIVGFVAPQQDFDVYHALLHFLTGVVALGFGTVGTARHTQIAGLALGVLYLALGVLGIALGDPVASRAWNTGLFTVSMGDHVFHSLVGVLFLAVASFAASR